MTLRYVGIEAFKSSASIPDSMTDADVSMVLAASEHAVEQACSAGQFKRRFWKDAAPTTRTYTAYDYCKIRIDDIVDVDAVTVDGVAVTGFVPGPLNAAADGEPYLYLEASTPSVALFTSITRGGVAVTGTFGWPVIPDEVKQMVTILGSRLLKRTREAPFGVVNAGGIDGAAIYLARSDPEIKTLIDPLIRYS